MGNRKQPFGYRMTLGEITILPEEAELVRFIFQGYSTGATLGELTKALCRQEIPYYEGRTWNKNMVSRIFRGWPLHRRERLSGTHRAGAAPRGSEKEDGKSPPAAENARAEGPAAALRHPPSERGGEDRHRPAQRAHTLPRPYSAIDIPSSRRCLRKNAGGADLRAGAAAHRRGQRQSVTPFNWRQSSTTPSGTRNTKPCGCGGCSPAESPCRSWMRSCCKARCQRCV